jgi:hypothetical protein
VLKSSYTSNYPLLKPAAAIRGAFAKEKHINMKQLYIYIKEIPPSFRGRHKGKKIFDPPPKQRIRSRPRMGVAVGRLVVFSHWHIVLDLLVDKHLHWLVHVPSILRRDQGERNTLQTCGYPHAYFQIAHSCRLDGLIGQCCGLRDGAPKGSPSACADGDTSCVGLVWNDR